MDREALIAKYGDPDVMKNGTVCKIYDDAPSAKVGAERLKALLNVQEMSTDVMRSKMKRICLQKKKLRQRKELLENFLGQPFEIRSSLPSLPPPSTSSTTQSQSSQTQMSDVLLSRPPSLSRSPSKTLNTAQFNIAKKERQLSALSKKVESMRSDLAKMSSRKGHFSVHNVRRREQRLRKERDELRMERARYRTLSIQQEKEIECLKSKLEEATQISKSQLDDAEEKFNKLQENKRRVEKKAAYYMMALTKERLRTCRIEEENKALLEEDRDERERMIQTMENGKFNEKMRLCVLELTGLEVATGKVSEVIECVGRTVCGVKFFKLPSRNTCQGIVDEGQYIVKSLLADDLERCGGWGLHKDGTSRKKVKILDTSIHTDDGVSYCLGFSSVASETGVAIAKEAEEKLGELCETVGDERPFKKEMLRKLKYYMNDRAANEKKSSRLLDEWRERELEGVEGEGGHLAEVKHLHCMAHVLLGFQSKTLEGLKEVMAPVSGVLKHPILVLLRDAADLFGPVGDYRGLRNVWEAHCQVKGMKSLIENFKDNRFNGLFEVAAQVFHHHEDFVSLLEKKSTGNVKQSRLLKFLRNHELILILECLALFFHKVTGPFWNLVISESVSPGSLHPYIQHLKNSLQHTEKDPSHLFQVDSFDLLRPFRPSPDTKVKLSESPKSLSMEKIITSIARSFLKTIDCQLQEFSQGGSHAEPDALSSVSFAPVTNLICERNFGHLDSSQRRRPRASLHHHSSVIMLKQNRDRLRTINSRYSLSHRKIMWAKATAMGKIFRKRHRLQDRGVILESLQHKPTSIPQKQKKKASNQAQFVPPRSLLKKGQMVAVACDDNWYPGIVTNDSRDDDEVSVNFGQLERNLGVFKWPNGRDVHMVNRRSIIATQLEIVPRCGGRSWLIQNAKAIQRKYTLSK